MNNNAEKLHSSVLLQEVLDILEPRPGQLIVDATLGLGGHAEAILEMAEGAIVIGIDQDAEAMAHAKLRLKRFGDRVKFASANFSEIKHVLRENNITKADGVIADLGVSSIQFDSPVRGFSFRFDAPLDMRMDPDSASPTAADLLASLPENEIADIIYKYGEERASRRIARRIVQKREAGEPVRTTRDLARIVESAVKWSKKDKIHPATRTFQALRIAVNRELDVLPDFITDAIDTLAPDGRLAVITFHSLEDRIVKQTFQRLSGKCFCPPRIPQCVCGAEKKVEVITRKPIVPSDDEILKNPRSRSAKLRAVRRLEN